ncbi:hypothetical protein HYC85_025956 [Camellia sinensis]|uniref:t-SNARE coiled-coil homology domain-containing protein n=1 Tax=Camellia sinensis TaxID=4442 RepID=A0A7J7G2U9_CAMSI|nr:hypothetical protein HYC85_025956 [Camellia sinensis]
MNARREFRNNRAALFDGIEEGGIRASSSYSSHEIDEHDNDRAMDGLQDRVNMLKRLTGDIHEEVEGHNRMLDRMGNDMDASRGILSGTMDKFKMVDSTNVLVKWHPQQKRAIGAPLLKKASRVRISPFYSPFLHLISTCFKFVFVLIV